MAPKPFESNVSIPSGSFPADLENLEYLLKLRFGLSYGPQTMTFFRFRCCLIPRPCLFFRHSRGRERERERERERGREAKQRGGGGGGGGGGGSGNLSWASDPPSFLFHIVSY